MSRKAGLVVVGMGRMGTLHARNIKRDVDRARLVAVVDVDAERARAVGEELHVPHYTDTERALDAHKGEIDGVVIATVTATHLEQIRLAAERGVHVFVEKPMGADVREDEEIVNIVRKRGVKLQVGFQRRYDKSLRRIKSSLEEGVLGRPLMLNIVVRDPKPPPGLGIGKLYPGAVFDDMLIHDFDTVNWLVGYPPEQLYVNAAALYFDEYRDAGDFDNVVVTMKYREGPLVTIEASRCSSYGYDLRVEVLGADAMVRLSDVFEHHAEVYRGNTIEVGPRPWLERWHEAFVEEIRAFAESIVDDRPTTPNEVDGKIAGELAEHARRSALEGRIIRFQ